MWYAELIFHHKYGHYNGFFRFSSFCFDFHRILSYSRDGRCTYDSKFVCSIKISVHYSYKKYFLISMTHCETPDISWFARLTSTIRHVKITYVAAPCLVIELGTIFSLIQSELKGNTGPPEMWSIRWVTHSIGPFYLT